MAQNRAHGRARRGRRKFLAALAIACSLGGCSLYAPLPAPSSLDDRLDAFPTVGLPLDAPVIVRWNDHQIPYIEAQSDADGAFVLGLVHAHLRLGQMEVARRVAKGRIGEMAGPFFTDIDRSLRALGFGRAAPAIVAAWPTETRRWVSRFVAGINHYQSRMREAPHEYRVFALAREPWTAEDVVTLGRLAGTDVTWLTWMALLPFRDDPDWPRIWRQALELGGLSPPSFALPPEFRLARDDSESDDPRLSLAAEKREAVEHATRLAGILENFARSGSNSAAVSGARSATGGALIANDPHLGLMVPNLWLLAGLRSPSFHAVGAMAPGLPVFAFGRNRDIAWGGTNLRAANSDLFDASGIAADEIKIETHAIGRRFWFDIEAENRVTSLGPVISDTPMVPKSSRSPFALSWVGYLATDELTAMMGVNRAANWPEFRAALAPFGVPAQNFVYADIGGNIGQATATRLPRRPATPPADIVQNPAERAADWRRMLGPSELPATLNPDAGFLASANNRPAAFAVPIGYFFAPGDRMERMAELLGGTAKIGPEDMKRLQQDVRSSSARATRDAVLARARAVSGKSAETAALLREWPGDYDVDSRAALAFESLFAALAPAVFRATGRAREFAWLGQSSFARAAFLRALDELDDDALAPLLGHAFAAAGEALARHGTWGQVHRLQLNHPLADLPFGGAPYRFLDVPSGGSNETLMKAAHGLKVESGRVRYGSQARHVSDLSHPDANWFVLLGGQDGWFNSSTFLDQVPLWREGRYIRLPLEPETVAREFSRELVLEPPPRSADLGKAPDGGGGNQRGVEP